MKDYSDLLNDKVNDLNYEQQLDLLKNWDKIYSGNNNTTKVDSDYSSQSNIDYSWQSGNNFLEPVADLIFKAITTVFPGFKK